MNDDGDGVVHGAVERNVPLLLRLADKVADGSDRSVRTIARRIRANGLRANRIARSYGFKVCGSR